MTSFQFCYWLQGYFEIARNPCLDFRKLLFIKRRLATVEGERGAFINWLSEVCDYIERTRNCSVPIEEFFPLIQSSLSSVFLHVIDDSYEIDKEERLKVHGADLHDK